MTTESKREYMREWKKRNAEAQSRYMKIWRANNQEKLREYEKSRDMDLVRKRRKAQWAADPKGRSQALREWIEKNRYRTRFYSMNRHAKKLEATPAWADAELMDLVYAEAAHRKMAVDHIIPLRGKHVCGLHVFNNTQLLTKGQNSVKGNKFCPITEGTSWT